MADATIDLELNAKQLYAELQTAEHRYTQGMDRIGQSANRVAGAHDHLTVRTKAAGRSIHTLAQDLASGADASTLFSDALLGIGKSLKISLGALAGIGIGAVAISKIYELRAEFSKLNAEVQKLIAPRNPNIETLAAVEEHFKAAGDQLKRLKEEAKGGWIQNIKDAFGENMFTENGELLPDSGKAGRRRAKDISALEAGMSTDDLEEARRRREKHGLLTMPGADWEKKAAQLKSNNEDSVADAMSKNKGHLAAAIHEELASAFESLAADIAAKRRERVQMSLGELAATPEDNTNRSMSYERWQSGQLARSAKQWDTYGESRRVAGDMQGAQEAFNYSSEIKRSIPGLKDSEKDLKGEFKGALDESDVLNQIEHNTSQQQRLVNR